MSFFLLTSSCPPSCPHLWRSPNAPTTLLSVITWTYLLMSPTKDQSIYFMQTAWLTDLFHERQLSTTRLSLTGAFSTTLTCKTPLATSQHQLDGNRGVTLSSHPSGTPPGYQGMQHCSVSCAGSALVPEEFSCQPP